MIIILVGVPGSGKTTVLNALKSTYPSIDIVNYGEVMLKEAALQGLERDALRKLPVDKQQEIGLAACQRIAKEDKKLTIVDTHACIKTPVGYCPGIPLKVLNALNPKGLVLVQASPSIIVERRAKDSQRKRDDEDLNELSLHQELTRNYLVAASTLTGAVLCIVNNDSENLSNNIQPLVQFINEIKGN